jgi:hypothetical protein
MTAYYTTGFIITKDHLAPQSTSMDDLSMTPRVFMDFGDQAVAAGKATTEALLAWRKGTGPKPAGAKFFRLYDDDGELHYEGYLIDRDDADAWPDDPWYLVYKWGEYFSGTTDIRDARGHSIIG